MEKNINRLESILRDKNDIQKKKNYSFIENLKNPSESNISLQTKNVFLSLPKLNTRENRIKKSFLKTLNLSLRNKRNRTIDTSCEDNIIKYEHTTPSIPNKTKKEFINIAIIDKNNKNSKINRFTVIFENPKTKALHQNKIKTNFNTILMNYQKNNNLKEISQLKHNINKSNEQKNSKTIIKPILNKKPSNDYIYQMYKNSKTFIIKEEPNMKLLNVGDLMIMQTKKKFKYNNDNKIGKTIEENNSKSCFKIGSKYYGEEKVKNLEERNAFYNKVKLLYDKDRENRFKKKYVRVRNVNDLLEQFKNRRFESCSKVIKKAILDVKKEKNFIADFFQNYKKVFDIYDDWDDPKNKDNLYNN